MSAQPAPLVNFRQIVTTLKQRWWLVAVPLVACSLLSLAYALLRKPTWEATQTLQVRDETGGGKDVRPGRFETLDSMKTAQETILEIAKNQQVAAAALAKAGPPAARTSKEPFPTALEIDDLRKAIKVSPPHGAELGRTEIIYLAVKDHGRERAVELATAVCDQLEERLKELRSSKAKSIIAELVRTLNLAQTDLDAATARLEAMETSVGRDLGELRILNEAGAGESNLRSALNQIKSELRQADTLRQANLELHKFLVSARQDPDSIVAAPNRLLESQPALKRLKEGLVDAQLRTAQAAALMTQDHPKVKAAILGENLVRRDLHNELVIAIRGLDADLQVGKSQIESLEAQVADVSGRLDKLAALRARYANLVADVKQRNEILEKSKKELADARASQAAAASVSLISRLDTPQTGNYPIGPGRTMIVGGGTAGGLFLGVGLVFLVTPFSSFRGRRWSDYLGFGRRATDRKRLSDAQDSRQVPGVVAVPTRRAEDAHPAAEAAAPPYPLTPTISPEYRGEEEIQRVRQVQPERKIQPAEEVSAVGENQPVREVSPVVFPAQSPAMLCLSVDEENVGAIAPSVVTRGECHDDLNHEIFIAVQTLPEKIDLPRPPVEADETEEMLEPEAPAPVEVAPPMQAVAEANVPALKETMPAVPTAHVVTDPEVAPPPPAIVVIAPPAPLPQQVLTLPMSEPLAEGNSGPTATLSLAESLSRLGQQATW